MARKKRSRKTVREVPGRLGKAYKAGKVRARMVWRGDRWVGVPEASDEVRSLIGEEGGE